MRERDRVNVKRVLLLAVFMVAVAQPLAPAAAAATRVVYPTGNALVDVVHVRIAVAAGGRVILKATNSKGIPTAFNFRPVASPPPALLVEPLRASVLITRDVEVLGEVTARYMTTIVSGSPFWCYLCRARIAVRNIHFERSIYAPLYLVDPKSVDLTGNRITNVQPGELSGGVLYARGIVVSGVRAPSILSGNYIDNVVGENSTGIDVVQSPTRVEVTRNEVRRVNGNGIHAFFGVDSLDITANLVVPGPEIMPDQSAGNGILVSFPRAAVDGIALSNRYRIMQNTVVTENPNAAGIYLSRGPDGDASTTDIAGALVTENHVVVRGSIYGAIGIGGRGIDNVVSYNRIDGTADWAVALLGDGPSGAIVEENTFAENDMSRFTGALADVYFDANTRRNSFTGEACVVVDEGSENRVSITGCTKI